MHSSFIFLHARRLTSNIELGCLFSVIDAVVDVDTISANIRMIALADRKREDIEFRFNLVFS